MAYNVLTPFKQHNLIDKEEFNEILNLERACDIRGDMQEAFERLFGDNEVTMDDVLYGLWSLKHPKEINAKIMYDKVKIHKNIHNGLYYKEMDFTKHFVVNNHIDFIYMDRSGDMLQHILLNDPLTHAYNETINENLNDALYQYVSMVIKPNVNPAKARVFKILQFDSIDDFKEYYIQNNPKKEGDDRWQI